MKALALIDSDPQLKGICEALKDRREALISRLEFLQKQVGAAKEQFNKDADPLWNALVNRLVELGKLPADFDRHNPENNLRCDIGANLISLEQLRNHDHNDAFMIPIYLPPGFNPFGGPEKSR